MLYSNTTETPVTSTGTNGKVSGRISVESVRRVFARLDPAEAQMFERDLGIYGRTGEQSDFLLSILAIAAGEMNESPSSLH